MKVKIKRFDKSLPMPEYKTPGAVGFDLYVKNNETISSHEVKLLKANVAIKIPKAEFVEVSKMSSKSRGGFGTTGHN